MTKYKDAFAHHPELRDLVADPESSFFRTFQARRFFEDKPDLRWVLDHLHTDDAREATRRDALAGHDGDLWIFAYGSLMWDPAIHFVEVRRARLTGYARRFILKDIYGARGTRENPGLMAALDRGDTCSGLVFRIAAEAVDHETEILWNREKIGPGYLPTFVTAETDRGPVQALTFVANHDAPAICPELDPAEQVRFIATGSGFMGSSRDYLANIIDHFNALGIQDPDCHALLEAVDTYIATTSDGATP
ncbi:cation transport protein ChaC [Aliiruegeria haliotis]|uniref:glutathione-specific gamma-glutamylcyclotransferase n=1 Tax=Aliiruegeria haliotis TaxID=1280846 RepID=A0A2T0RTR4_9RHOB|nr:gamma-glutamylcyclotransferase [Aliiruegeria haliotis]PRY24527.1 cation transport protein ChaC [Aliiruegeria haliotis]